MKADDLDAAEAANIDTAMRIEAIQAAVAPRRATTLRNIEGELIAIGALDGSWWCDWPKVERMADRDPALWTADPRAVARIMLARLLSRRGFVSITREQAE